MKRIAAQCTMILLAFITPFAFGKTIRPIEKALLDIIVTAQVLHAPSPAVIDGKTYLPYEISLANVGSKPVIVKSLEIYDPKQPEKILFTYSGKNLTDLLRSFSANKEEASHPEILKPGATEFVYVTLKFNNAYDIPKKLVSSFTLESKQSTPSQSKLVLKAMPIKETTPTVIGAPLEGDKWVAFNGFSNTSPHRRAFFVVDGVPYFSQRFAIDFMQLGSNNNVYQGDPKKNKSYATYGAKLLAVADGKVVTVVDNIPDNTPGKLDVPINMQTIGGNYVLIDIGNSRYAWYSHIIPGTIKVKAGDVVKKGQVIGLAGNSGNSTAPHLHFGIVDAPSIFASEGVPYAFEKFESWPIKRIDENTGTIETGNKPETRHNELVGENAIVDFPK